MFLVNKSLIMSGEAMCAFGWKALFAIFQKCKPAMRNLSFYMREPSICLFDVFFSQVSLRCLLILLFINLVYASVHREAGKI